MFKKFLCSTLIFSSIISISHADIITTDYLSEGDGLVSLHEETGIEWLDLTLTKGIGLNNVYQEIETNFIGWRIPTMDEMIGLFSEVSPSQDLSKRSLSLSIEERNNWLDKFGPTDGTSYSSGWHLADDGTMQLSGLHYNSVFYGPNYYASYSRYNNGFNRLGFFLVSDGGYSYSSINNPLMNINNPNAPVEVHEPSSIAIFGLSAIMLMAGARRKKKS
jgi:hypothetical protein